MKLSIKVEIPRELVWTMDGQRAEERMGAPVATYLRRRLRAGQGARGALPQADDEAAKKPLRRTGELERSIRYSRRSRSIWPGRPATRSDGKRNGAVLAILIATQRAIEMADPMGPDAEAERIAEKALRRHMARLQDRLIRARGRRRIG